MLIFGNRLRDLRHEHHMRQEDLAKHLQISKSSVGMYERGEREPSLVTLRTIADFFHVTTDYLLGRTDDRNLTVPKAKSSSKDDTVVSTGSRVSRKKALNRNLKEVLKQDELYWGNIPFSQRERSAIKELMNLMVSEKPPRYGKKNEEE